MQNFQLPGAVWSALLVALPLLAAWLEQYFPGAIWAAPIAGLLLIAAKVLVVAREPAAPTPPVMPPGSAPRPAGDAAPVGDKPRSRAARVLWG